MSRGVLRGRHVLRVGFLLLALAASASPLGAQGIMLSTTGPVNRSMAGAATAAPLDAIGAVRWNPATVSGLPSSEVAFGLDLVWAHVEVDSSIAGLGAGTTVADPGVCYVPAVGWVHHLDDSPLTLALGVYGVAGFRSNYPASPTNPIFAPQSNTPGVPGGLGRVYTAAEFMEIAPTLSVALTEQLSVAVSPTLVLAELFIDPLLVIPPDDADGSGAATYPVAHGTRNHWGAGVQVGAYYIVNDDWRLGAAIKSPDWMETFTFQTEDELGRPRVGTFELDLPMIVSGGVSYAGLESVLIALDVRYFDYRNTDGFGQRGFSPDGALQGVGWRSVMSVNTGVQVQLLDPLYVRAGYTYNQNPTPSDQAMTAVAAALHYQHQFNVGGSYRIGPNTWVNAAYSYWFEHEVTGPIFTPLGVVPGSSVTSREYVHIGSLGVSVGY